jgi:ABC-type multidrug transport system fused ATPase/permease subunit
VLGDGFLRVAQDLPERYPDSDLCRAWGIEGYLGIPVTGCSGEVLGHLAAMDVEPLQPESGAGWILELLALRAGAEIERGAVEDELRRSESRYRALVEQIPAVTYIARMDEKATAVYVSPQILATFIDVAVAPATASAATETDGRLDPLFRTGLLFLIVAIVRQAFTVGVDYTGKDLGWKTTNALRADLALHCLRLDMSFHNARTPGEMIERVDGDVNTLSNLFSQFVVQIVGNAILLVGVLWMLFRADWRAGLAMSLFGLATLLIVGRLQGFGSSLWKERREAISALFGFLEERMAGTEDIRSSGATAYVMHRFYHLLRVAHRTLVRAGTIGAGITVNTADVLFALGSVTALGLGATLYQQGLLTIGTVYLILHYTQMMMWPIREVTRQVQDLQRAGAGVTRDSGRCCGVRVIARSALEGHREAAAKP